MTTLIPGLSARRLFRRRPAAGLRALWQFFWYGFRRRRELSHLMAVNDHLLRDVGLTRDQVRQALDTPFWRR